MTFNLLRTRINRYLQDCLILDDKTPRELHDAMRYVVLNGGKRFRPLLVYATGLCFDTDLAHLDRPAAAVELIHCYSLVHDDLPAMDNDDFRRGQPSCHKAYRESTAILVGDALQSLAFQLLSESNAELVPELQLRMIQALAVASGPSGMAGGQQLDLAHQHEFVDDHLRHEINRLKTGALFEASVVLGALASNIKDEDLLVSLQQFAEAIGIFFQKQDDLFDADTNSTSPTVTSVPLFTNVLQLLKGKNINTKPLREFCNLLETRTY